MEATPVPHMSTAMLLIAGDDLAQDPEFVGQPQHRALSGYEAIRPTLDDESFDLVGRHLSAQARRPFHESYGSPE